MGRVRRAKSVLSLSFVEHLSFRKLRCMFTFPITVPTIGSEQVCSCCDTNVPWCIDLAGRLAQCLPSGSACFLEPQR
jgi:hypothetical protein